jgi:hypothetical protein
MVSTDRDRLPKFSFEVPKGYYWLLERGLVGFAPFTALQPWHYLDHQSVFWADERWPSGQQIGRLFTFAKRQDSDDLACFSLSGERVDGIAVIHGWTNSGFTLMAMHRDIWTWLKSVVDDIAAWSERSPT